MNRIAIGVLSIACSLSLASADDLAPLPLKFKVHMETMVGSWNFTGHEGDRTFEGEETITLANGGTALLQQGFFQLDDGNREHYVILSGWDGERKTMLVRGFTNEGYTWTGTWDTLQNNVWTGTAEGGKATFEVKPNSMRYEDAANDDPWVSEFTRKMDQ